jgi:alpha-methylacyl-CoA racemase
MLADYGARVIKIRPPIEADLLEPPTHVYSGDRDIERLRVDLKAPGALGLMERLIESATVVVESFRPGVIARLGLGFEAVAKIKPDVIFCSISGYGQAGPSALRPGHDLNYLGVGGYLATSGRDTQGAPALPGASIADAAGGFCAAIAILTALVSRQGGPVEPVYLDVSVTDSVLRFTQMWIDQFLFTGDEASFGSDQLLGGRACYGVYEAGDGKWITLGALEPRFWQKFCTVVGLEHLIVQQHEPSAQEAIRNEVRAVLKTRTRDEWLQALEDVTAVAPVNSIAEVVADPQLRASPLVWEVPAADGRLMRQMAPRLAGTSDAPTPGSTVPAPGSTSEQKVLAELGYSLTDIENLRRSGVLR